MNSWLKFSCHDSDDQKSPRFLVTVDKDFQALRVLDREGNDFQDAEWMSGLLTGLPCPNEGSKGEDSKKPFMDVMINHNFIVVQYLDDTMRMSQFTLIPLPLGKWVSK